MNVPNSSHRTIWAFVFSVIATIALLLAVRSTADYRWEVHQLEERLMAQARVVDENLTANLSSSNLALEYIKHELNDIPSHRFNRFLKTQCARMPGVRSLLVIDEWGRVTHSNREELVGLDFSKRDYFVTTRNAPDKNMLFLSPPFKSVLGPYIMNITSPIRGKQGEFKGVITVSLSQDYFQTLLKSTIFSPDNRIALIHSEGTVFTAIPDDSNSVIGKNLMGPGSLLYRHAQGGTSTSIQSGQSATTGDYRVFAYITNSSKDLHVDKHFIVGASRNLNEVLVRWRINYAIQLSLYLLLSSLGIFITRKMLQRSAELARTAEYNRALLDSIHSSVAILDKSGVIVSINDAWNNFAETNRTVDGELPCHYREGTSYLDVCRGSYGDYSDQAQEALDGISAVLAGRAESYSLEYPCHSPSRQRWFLLKAEPLRSESGGAVITHIDISNLKQTYQKLEQRERDMKLLLDNVPAMIGYWNRDLYCRFGNRAYHEWFGVEPDCMPGMHFREVVGEERYQLNLTYIEGALQGKSQHFERDIPTPDGSSIRHSQASYIPDRYNDEIVGFYVLVTDVTAIKQAQQELEQLNIELGEANSRLASLSTTDGLTGIANRRHFDDVLNREYFRLARTESELSLIMIDIDSFKLFNDHYGHVSGDKCLQQIAGVIDKSAVRPGDLAVRYGGEEFACILPDTDQQGALIVAERIRQGIINLAIPHEWSDIANCVTASLGVVTLTCHKEEPASEIVVRADELLYKAKDLGRNRIEYNVVSPKKLDVNFVQLVWQESFTLGNELLDDQHKRLFLDSNILLHAIIKSSAKDEISRIISQLIDDITKHFIAEENILVSIGYPFVKQHSIEHEKLKKRALDLAEDFSLNEIHVGDVFEFLVYEVIKKHMLEYDREYSTYLDAALIAE